MLNSSKVDKVAIKLLFIKMSNIPSSFIEIRKTIVLVVKNCQKVLLKKFTAEASIDVLGFRWILHASKDHLGFLDLSLDAKPPTGYTGHYNFNTKAFVFF
jgi:hypothetical protein